jgi:arylformamidase
MIYKQYDQSSLNRQYNNRLQVPDFATYLARWEAASRFTEQSHTVHKDIPYDNGEREQLDIYPSSQPNSKTLIFIHGGYWQRFDKSLFHFIAPAFLENNVTVVILNYPLGPVANMDQITASCRNAVSWIYNNISNYNGDPSQLYLVGHSAGGHLAAMMLATNWSEYDLGLPVDIFKGVCAISGLFNLVPIQLSEVNDALKMDTAMAERNSPIDLKPVVKCPFIVVVGANETSEFNDQSITFYARWCDQIPLQLLQLLGFNHFSVIETLGEPGSTLQQAVHDLLHPEN